MHLINSQSLDGHREERAKRGGLEEMGFKKEESSKLKDTRGGCDGVLN